MVSIEQMDSEVEDDKDLGDDEIEGGDFEGEESRYEKQELVARPYNSPFGTETEDFVNKLIVKNER